MVRFEPSSCYSLAGSLRVNSARMGRFYFQEKKRPLMTTTERDRLPDDPVAFGQHVKAYFDEYKPQGLRERELVQSLAETRWRLNRSFALEAALFSQIASDTQEGTPTPGNVQNLLKYEKTLKNLHLQEARLHRRFDNDLTELRELQQTRAREQMLGTNVTSPAGAVDPKMGSNFQMLKDMLEMDGFKLPKGSKSPSNGKHFPKS
jgi:hypothetical protein